MIEDGILNDTKRKNYWERMVNSRYQVISWNLIDIVFTNQKQNTKKKMKL